MPRREVASGTLFLFCEVSKTTYFPRESLPLLAAPRYSLRAVAPVTNSAAMTRCGQHRSHLADSGAVSSMIWKAFRLACG